MKKSQNSKQRSLRFENLEERQLLSVTPTEFAEIQATYSEFQIGSDANVIEINANELSATSLKNAIAKASETVGEDLIVLRTTDAAHTMTLKSIYEEISIDNDASTSGKITIVGYGTQKLTIDANSLCRAMSIGKSAKVNLGSIEICNGVSTSSLTNQEKGGGIYSMGTLALSNCNVSNNLAEKDAQFAYGGGIYSGGILTLNNTIVALNSVKGGEFSFGGGVYVERGALSLQNSDIVGNVVVGVTESFGGGISMRHCDYLTINESTLYTNSVSSYQYGYGGGIYLYQVDTVTITQSTFRENNSTNRGGAFYSNFATVSVTQSLFYGNTSRYGGAVYIFHTTMDIIHSTVTRNTAFSCGGAFVVGGTLNSKNCIIAENLISRSGLSEEELEDVKGKDIKRTTTGIINGYYTLSSNVYWHTTSSGVINYVYDWSRPLFKDAENGDFTLCADSQAVNQGNNDFTVYPSGEAIELDFAGNTRIVDEIVDLGAYEYQTPVVPALSSPTGLTVASYGANRVSVKWDGVANAQSYQLAYSTDEENWTTIDLSGTSYLMTGLTYGQTIHYIVKAIGDGTHYQDSPFSAAVYNTVCPMDINGDGIININDYSIFSAHYFTKLGDANWDQRCDIDGDGVVNLSDLKYLSANMTKKATSETLYYPKPMNAASITPSASKAFFSLNSGEDDEDDFDFVSPETADSYQAASPDLSTALGNVF